MSCVSVVFSSRGRNTSFALVTGVQTCALPIWPIAGGRFTSRPGVFAWDRIDAASVLLAEQLPADLRGHAADLGAGWGYLSVELLQRCPGITALDLFEAEARALELARVNLAPFATRAKLGFHWHDVTAGLAQRFDVIVHNPPFHAQGRPDARRVGKASLRKVRSRWSTNH